MNIDNFENRTAELENTDAHLHRKIGDIDNYSSKLDDVLTMIANSLAVLIKERKIQPLFSPNELATLMARVDELENTSSGMAVMKLQDSIDELQSHIEELEVDIAEIDRRLDGASITI